MKTCERQSHASCLLIWRLRHFAAGYRAVVTHVKVMMKSMKMSLVSFVFVLRSNSEIKPIAPVKLADTQATVKLTLKLFL